MAYFKSVVPDALANQVRKCKSETINSNDHDKIDLC